MDFACFACKPAAATFMQLCYDFRHAVRTCPFLTSVPGPEIPDVFVLRVQGSHESVVSDVMNIGVATLPNASGQSQRHRAPRLLAAGLCRKATLGVDDAFAECFLWTAHLPPNMRGCQHDPGLETTGWQMSANSSLKLRSATEDPFQHICPRDGKYHSSH